MVYDLVLLVNIVLYVGTLVLLVLARRWVERDEQFTRWAGILGLIAGTATLVTNVLVVTSPDLYEATGQWVLLLISVAALPIVVLVGAALTVWRKRGGVPMLVISSCLWLLVCAAGVGITLNGGF
jgi:cytochrome bd-type quinol oxidase subunit 2